MGGRGSSHGACTTQRTYQPGLARSHQDRRQCLSKIMARTTTQSSHERLAASGFQLHAERTAGAFLVLSRGTNWKSGISDGLHYVQKLANALFVPYRAIQEIELTTRMDMHYEKLSTPTLQDFHSSIADCLQVDDNTRAGTMKPYGVREFPDWKEQLDQLEIELVKREASFTPIVLTKSGVQQKPTPVEAVLYERIRACLAYEDQLPVEKEKPYGVRTFGDWRVQADQLEKALDDRGHSYSKIAW